MQSHDQRPLVPIAATKGITPAQLALAWVLAQVQVQGDRYPAHVEALVGR